MTWIVRLLSALFICWPYYLQAAEYDSLLLRAQASIFPKIVMLDAAATSKLKNNIVVLHVIYESSDRKAAESMKRLIEDNYGNKIGGQALVVDLVDVESVADDLPTAYIVMNVETNLALKIASIASANQRICFSYDHSDLNNDSLISLQLKEKVYIYLNKNKLNAYGVKFKPVFYNIVKLVE